MAKTKKIATFAIPMLAAVMFMSAIAPAYAGVGNGAEVVINKDDGLCAFMDGNGVFTGHDDAKKIKVFTNSANGNINAICHVKGVANDTGGEVVWNFANTGLPCLVLGGGPTNNWEVTISENGNAVFHCHFKT